MDPGEILNRARSAALAGSHKAALRDFIWFHKHALKHDSAYYGVRLSFALSYWAELGKVYSPAMTALQDIKRKAEATLTLGKGSRELFHDIASINRELGRVIDTYKLFVAVKKDHPTQARQYADLAMASIVAAKDFKLAAQHLPHPESYLLWLSDCLNEKLEQKGLTRKVAAMRRGAYVRNYCDDVQFGLKTLKGLHNHDAAKAALIWAIALVRQKQARSMVCEQLTAK